MLPEGRKNEAWTIRKKHEIAWLRFSVVSPSAVQGEGAGEGGFKQHSADRIIQGQISPPTGSKEIFKQWIIL